MSCFARDFIENRPTSDMTTQYSNSDYAISRRNFHVQIARSLEFWLNSRGVQADASEQFQYLTRATDKGDAGAFVEIGMMCENGTGAEKLDEKG
jgi:hypothetical protein